MGYVLRPVSRSVSDKKWQDTVTQNSNEKGRIRDVVIVGGGPGGIAAGIWCSDLGLDAVLLERSELLGGQLHQIYGKFTNYPGVEVENGIELQRRFAGTLRRTSVEIRTGVTVSSIDVASKTVTLNEEEAIAARAIVIATGVRRRKLGIPGEDEFQGRGVLDSGVKDPEVVAGKHVVIIGGGDAALENALILSKTASQVTLVHRRDRFTARAEFIESLTRLENVAVKFSTRVAEIGGESKVTHAVLSPIDKPDGERSPCDYVLPRIGVEPNSELLRGKVAMDADGYVEVDSHCSTNVRGIFAVGDVTAVGSPTIATASGMGATAAKNILATCLAD